MRTLIVSPRVVSLSLAGALLSACGGSSVPMAGIGNANNGAASKSEKTFHYTGKEQVFTVPPGVTRLTVVARGGEGAGNAYYGSSDDPGLPGRVFATIHVQPKDKLYVFVGGSGAHGGFNGGGAGGSEEKYKGNGGGGASDVRIGGDALTDRVIVAAGGGGAGEAINDYGSASGGYGGGLSGKSGGGGGQRLNGQGGGGGKQSSGGMGGAGGISSSSGSQSAEPGGNGTLGVGGNGGAAAYEFAGNGGGGGGGYYGGSGGGAGAWLYSSESQTDQGGGGGGGSSYVESSAIKSRTWTGWKAKGDGLVVFSWN